jgi:hypothetical protein
MRERIYPAALVCSVLANVNRDPDKRPEPWQPADFMPGAKSEEDEMREFAEKVMRGEKFEPDLEAIATFKQQMRVSFKNVVTPACTNAIAGDGPKRGLN